MATIEHPLHGPATYIDSRANTNQETRRLETTGRAPQHKAPKPPVLIMAAYFLALASIAVVAIGGQFPWFTVAPATVLSLVAYFRHVEGSYASR